MLRPLVLPLVILLTLLGLAAPVSAQTFTTPPGVSCANQTTIAAPLVGRSFCFDAVTNRLKAYTTAYGGNHWLTMPVGAPFYADDFAGANAGAKIANAIAAVPAAGGTVDARGLTGSQSVAATITIPANVLLLLGQVTLAGSVDPLISIFLGSNGTSGSLQGSGRQTILSYTGSGDAVFLNGAGQSSADPFIADCLINGTSAGASGIRLKAFNRGLIRNVIITGFTTGDAIKNEGANSITIVSPNLRGNKNGLHNLTSVVAATNYAANMVAVFGGQIALNTGWGWYEDVAGSGGTNLGNAAFGVTFEQNGTNASSTTGSVFVQNCTACKFVGSYFEYGAGMVPTSNIVLGDATNAVKGIQLLGNNFLSMSATNSVNVVNASFTRIEGNDEGGTVTNFVNHSTDSRNTYIGKNSATGATNYFAGSDTGVDTLVLGSTGTQFNAFGHTVRGFGFNQLSGLNQDLVIRGRSGGTNTVIFQKIDGTQQGRLTDAGSLILSTSGLQLGTPTGGDQGAGTINTDIGYYADGAAGLTVTKTVRAAGGAADCTLIFTMGLLTGGTC